MIILIDRSAHRTQGVVAVGQNIRNRELRQPRCARGLNNSDKGNIMACQLIKFNFQLFHVAGSIVIL